MKTFSAVFGLSLAISCSAAAALQQNTIKLNPQELAPGSARVSEDQSKVEAFRQVIFAAPPTTSFECHNSKLKIEISTRGFLNKTCSDPLYERFTKNDPQGYRRCDSEGDLHEANLPTAVRVTNAGGKVLFAQNFNPVQTEILVGQTTYSYAYGSDVFLTYPAVNSARQNQNRVSLQWGNQRGKRITKHSQPESLRERGLSKAGSTRRFLE